MLTMLLHIEALLQCQNGVGAAYICIDWAHSLGGKRIKSITAEQVRVDHSIIRRYLVLELGV